MTVENGKEIASSSLAVTVCDAGANSGVKLKGRVGTYGRQIQKIEKKEGRIEQKRENR